MNKHEYLQQLFAHPVFIK